MPIPNDIDKKFKALRQAAVMGRACVIPTKRKDGSQAYALCLIRQGTENVGVVPIGELVEHPFDHFETPAGAIEWDTNKPLHSQVAEG